MIEIGRFTHTADGYIGAIQTLSLAFKLHILPAEPSDNRKAPQWHIYLGSADGQRIGAGWNHKSETAGESIQLIIDAPELLAPIRAGLVPSGDDEAMHLLLWARRSWRGARETQ